MEEVAVASGLIGDLLENLMTSQSETVRQQIAKEQRDDDDEPSVLEKSTQLLFSLPPSPGEGPLTATSAT